MRTGLRLTLAVAIAWGAILWLAPVSMAQPFAGIVIKGKPYVYDSDNAKDVMRICGGCHGELGAGGGGFFLFYVPPFCKHELMISLEDAGLKIRPFRFEQEGLRAWTARERKTRLESDGQ